VRAAATITQGWRPRRAAPRSYAGTRDASLRRMPAPTSSLERTWAAFSVTIIWTTLLVALIMTMVVVMMH
jgi:hypothetical protein